VSTSVRVRLRVVLPVTTLDGAAVRAATVASKSVSDVIGRPRYWLA
jgi:hypothetical protein